MTPFNSLHKKWIMKRLCHISNQCWYYITQTKNNDVKTKTEQKTINQLILQKYINAKKKGEKK